MTITKESYVDLQEKYEKIKKLIEEDSKLDPASEPYVSKYNAKMLLINMKANVENLLRSQNSDTKEFIKLTAMLGTVLLYLGRISIETEEASTGEKHLKKCQEVIDKYKIEPEVVLVTLSMFNELGLLWSERDSEKSKNYLETAETLYNEFKDAGTTPFDLHDLFRMNAVIDEAIGRKALEKVHTLTLYYLAQIYGSLGDAHKSSIYCHITLKRQLEMDDYDLIEWALNAATLSQFFMEKNGFKEARHHLASSSYMLEIYQNQLNQITEHDDEYKSKMENFKHRSADVARCWAKYGLLLLSNSRDRLMSEDETESTHTLSTDRSASHNDFANLQFSTLNLATQENQITDRFILTVEDARKVFLNVKLWLERAHAYYTLNNLASDYIEIVQDQSQLYLNLSFFEDSPKNQAKLHKRRIDLMESVLKEINPTYYMSYCRQLWFDLAQTYGEILYIKLDRLKESQERPGASTLAKINNFVDKAILHNNNFINSLKETNADVLPSTVPEQYEKPFLKAYMSNGAFYSRYISLDKEINLQHVEDSLECYQKVLDYCNKNPKVKEVLPTEISICTEMTTLLPVKINKLKHELPGNQPFGIN